MKKYLTLVRRADFVDLYKYGVFYLDETKVVEFECDVFDLQKDDKFFDALFNNRLNAFESPFAYLVINFEKEDGSDKSELFIADVKHLFPLDGNAKVEFETSFDEKIKIEDPLWPSALSKLQKRMMLEDSKLGVLNVFNVFGIEESLKNIEFISEESIASMLGDVYDGLPCRENDSLWVYLMRYERHSYYPKTSVGYFMDVVHVFCNYLRKESCNEEFVESTEVYKFLSTLVNESNLNSEKVKELLDKNAPDFVRRVNEQDQTTDFIMVAVTFLNLKNKYSDGLFRDDEFINSCKKHIELNCFAIASYMLGVVLGHGKTAECLYDKLHLSIFKSDAELSGIAIEKQKKKEFAKSQMERRDERESELRLGKGKSYASKYNYSAPKSISKKENEVSEEDKNSIKDNYLKSGKINKKDFKQKIHNSFDNKYTKKAIDSIIKEITELEKEKKEKKRNDPQQLSFLD